MGLICYTTIMDYLEQIKNIFLSPGVITFLSGLVLAALTWLLNEHGKRKHNDYMRKEESYKRLLKNLGGFYEGSVNTEQKKEFLEQVNLCWLYCPDDVIKKAYTFLNKVKAGATFSDQEKEKALKEFIYAVREDLLPRRSLFFKRGKLKSDDFEIFSST